jgi:hypothetical protein
VETSLPQGTKWNIYILILGWGMGGRLKATACATIFLLLWQLPTCAIFYT